MDSQIVIKVVLSLAVVIVGVGIAWPGRGARRMAIRRLGVLVVIVAVVVGIVNPALSDRVASLVGVGRGADLLLYGLTIAFGLYVVSARRDLAHVHRQILELARAEAILRASPPRVPEVDVRTPDPAPMGDAEGLDSE